MFNSVLDCEAGQSLVDIFEKNNVEYLVLEDGSCIVPDHGFTIEYADKNSLRLAKVYNNGIGQSTFIEAGSQLDEEETDWVIVQITFKTIISHTQFQESNPLLHQYFETRQIYPVINGDVVLAQLQGTVMRIKIDENGRVVGTVIDGVSKKATQEEVVSELENQTLSPNIELSNVSNRTQFTVYGDAVPNQDEEDPVE